LNRAELSPAPPGSFKKVLIANRGEIAIRIAATLREMGVHSVAMFSEDDADALHVSACDEAIGLTGRGPASYLDIGQVVRAATTVECDAVHPGYGFLSERSDAARAFESAGIRWIGPSAEALDVFGDKSRARGLASRLGVAVPEGLKGEVTIENIVSMLTRLGGGARLMIKAVAGGGGRGMRAVGLGDDIKSILSVCSDEAVAAFGDGRLYVERLLVSARHIEVQVAGDGTDAVALGDRDCSLQRRRQKLVEIAPAPQLSAACRESMRNASLGMAREVNLSGLATFEFLVTAGDEVFFLETNPRLQVEHTVTEEVFGLDLVSLQVSIAAGFSLSDLGLSQSLMTPKGCSLQLRVNLERLDAAGAFHPSGGAVSRYETPTGPGIRVDGGIATGSRANPRFDTLAAKLIVHSRHTEWRGLLSKARHALNQFRLDGVDSNLALLKALLDRSEVIECRLNIDLVDNILPELGAALSHDAGPVRNGDIFDAAGGEHVIRAPISGIVSEVSVEEGAVVLSRAQLVLIESMKMLHAVEAPASGLVLRRLVQPGDVVSEGQALVTIESRGADVGTAMVSETIDLDFIPESLAALRTRRALLMDDARPKAVARRRARSQRTARENLEAVCDPDSFVEYGGFAVAAQRSRRDLEDLARETPADGLIAGFAGINADLFGPSASRAAVLLYDFTVLAGTQGYFGHKKIDRVLIEAKRVATPVIVFAEGGGGRPGDVDIPGVAMLDTQTFATFASISGSAPLVGVVSGRCFAGNAVLLGCCDVIVATRDSNIGMSGPAMIEGAGLGVVPPEAIGPFDVQNRNGVIDLPVENEQEAAVVARQYLSYFQGSLADWTCADQRRLRSMIPSDPRRTYQVRGVLETLFDTGSVLELRPQFGRSVVTAMARIEGRAIGVLANDPNHLAGAIDADAGDKVARFMRLCDAFGLPLISLVDTPGFMVGPEIEAKAQVRHVCRMLVAGAKLKTPNLAVFLRRGFGLGSQAMVGGSFHAPLVTLAWPTGVFGAMGLEGGVRLGFRKELEAIPEGPDRQARFAVLLKAAKLAGEAVNMASVLEIDDVIDPADTRTALARTLRAVPEYARSETSSRTIDTW
jgi:acetyl/propionyl-CoA carboxylase alpha subunit/acetyl-CoA carboxylase carboxyltransferase component